MEELPLDIINVLLEPASWAAFVGASLAVLLIIVRRVMNGKLTPKWEGLMDKGAAVVHAAAAGLISVSQDSLDDILRPILVSLLVVGLSVGLYKYLGDLIFGPKPDTTPEALEPDSVDDFAPFMDYGDGDGTDEVLPDTIPEIPNPRSKPSDSPADSSSEE